MFMAIKNYLFLILLAATLLTGQPLALGAGNSDSAQVSPESMMDESLRDISVVLGIGAVGAVIGLSTLSFVNNPSKHWKNVTVGAAVGIVIGVAVVAFTQVSKSSSSVIGEELQPINADRFATLSRQDFGDYKIAKNYLSGPTIGYNFSF